MEIFSPGNYETKAVFHNMGPMGRMAVIRAQAFELA